MDEDIPAILQSTAPDADEAYYHIDQVWGYLWNVRKPGSISFEYDLLFKVAEVVLTIPHSNAVEERMFSLINKNKTPSRSSLNLQGTLLTNSHKNTH